MSKLLMEFYSVATGGRFSLKWSDESEFHRATAFLNELLAGDVGNASPKPGDIPFYYLKTRQQYDAVFDFQRRLRSETG